MKRTFAIFLSLALLLPAIVKAVDFQEEMKKMAQDNATGYIGPFATAFGTAMNSGLYHTAKPHALLGFDVSVKFSAMQIADEDLTYEFVFPRAPFEVTKPGDSTPTTLVVDLNQFFANHTTSTVFGDDQPPPFIPDETGVDAALRTSMEGAGWDAGAITTFMAQPEYTDLRNNLITQINPTGNGFTALPGTGFDKFGLPMPQVSVGLPFHTEVLVRFIPKAPAGDIGDVSFLGIGLKHSISQYIPLFPVDVSGQVVWQQLDIGDLISSNHTAFNVEASKKLGLPFLSITPYVGLGLEHSTLDVAYTVTNSQNPLIIPNGTEIGFNLEGDNSFRATGGVRLGLTILTVNVDYSVGKYSTVSAGVGLTLR